ncbi:MAG: hypothetical protein Q9220_006289 [cf. Caloplaca sp. 1 TL-2023]
MSTQTRFCVFGGASPGASPAHLAAARSLAKAMHKWKIQLVYGGGTTGIMGEIASTLVKSSGKDAVMGVIPSSKLSEERPGQVDEVKQENQEVRKTIEDPKKLPNNWKKRMGMAAGSTGKQSESTSAIDEKYGEVIIVSDIQARKRLMMELVRDGASDSGFVALSGGLGTIDELMEMMSWRQMGVHDRNSCILNVNGFWDGLLSWLEHATEERFVRKKSFQTLGVVEKAEDVVKWLQSNAGS